MTMGVKYSAWDIIYWVEIVIEGWVTDVFADHIWHEVAPDLVMCVLATSRALGVTELRVSGAGAESGARYHVAPPGPRGLDSVS